MQDRIILRIKTVLLLCLTSFYVQSQSRISISSDMAKLLVHTDNINFSSEAPAYGFMLSYTRATNPLNDSYKARGTPLVGLNLYYLDYGLKGLGKAIGLIPAVSFVHHISSRIHLESTIGIGLGYVTKYYNRQPWSDTFYNALGSHFNNFTRFAESAFIQLNNGDALSLNMSFSHLSSSSSSAPNFGTNLAAVGIGYHFIDAEHPAYGRPIKSHASSSRDAVYLGYSFTTDKQVVGLTFPVYTIGYRHHWVSPTRLASWFLGAEIIHDYKDKSILSWRRVHYDKVKLSDRLAYYLTMGREWYMGDFGFSLGINVGYSGDTRKFVHLEKPTLYYYPFNTDYSTQSLLRNLYLGVGLCTELSNAQYLDMTLGTYF